MFSKTPGMKSSHTQFCHQNLDSEGQLALDSPAEVAAVPAVPCDVAPPPPRPLHLCLLHSRHNGGRSFHLLGRGRRPAHLLHCGRLLLLTAVTTGAGAFTSLVGVGALLSSSTAGASFSSCWLLVGTTWRSLTNWICPVVDIHSGFLFRAQLSLSTVL